MNSEKPQTTVIKRRKIQFLVVPSVCAVVFSSLAFVAVGTSFGLSFLCGAVVMMVIISLFSMIAHAIVSSEGRTGSGSPFVFLLLPLKLLTLILPYYTFRAYGSSALIPFLSGLILVFFPVIVLGWRESRSEDEDDPSQL